MTNTNTSDHHPCKGCGKATDGHPTPGCGGDEYCITQSPKVSPRQGTLCLSIRQPWAWLIVNGWKNIENRDWPTRVRGRILIHASKSMIKADYNACILFVSGFAPNLIASIPLPAQLEQGGIVGEAVILDCVTRHDSEWFTGEYGFVLDQQKPLPFQPYKGSLGFFKYSPAKESAE